MENEDLKFLKKHYGEKFSHLCRDLFPTLLETKGLLTEAITSHFPYSRELYEDLVGNGKTGDFKNYIYSLIDVERETPAIIDKSPEELMDEAGYILYPECQTEEDIQSFRHYYFRGEPTPEYNGGTPEHWAGEEICTFNGGRLKSCRVWFAVKKNSDEIKRENFKNPRRQDEYGTSVLSLQFTKTTPSTLSIKNRYNHNVNQPDATFSNNLDNIIYGLTEAFTKTYNINLLGKNSYKLEIPNYIQTPDGKFYKYNLEINNIYYCLNNIIIDNGNVKILDPERYLVFGYFVLDLANKKIELYDKDLKDLSFIESIGKIKDIKRIPSKEGLTLQITPLKGEIVEIKLDKHNEIVGYSNPNASSIGDYFLYYNSSLTELSLPNVKTIGNNFLSCNSSLTKLDLPNTKQVGFHFLHDNESLTELNLPNVQTIGNDFLRNNRSLTELNLPNVQTIGENFLHDNESLTELNLPNVKTIGTGFLNENNKSLTELSLPKIQTIGDNFLYKNVSLTKLNLSNVQTIGTGFLYHNNYLTELNLSNVQTIGDYFLHFNNSLTKLNLSNVKTIGDYFLFANESLTELNLPNVQTIGDNFLYKNNSLTELNLPNVQTIRDNFLKNNKSLTNIFLPPKFKDLKDNLLLKNKNKDKEK